MNRLATSAIGVGAILCALTTTAAAQDATQPPPSSPPPSYSSSSYSGGGGGGHGKLGVGGIVYLGDSIVGGPIAGLSLVYDPGPWHIDTLLGFNDNPNTIRLGGRFWYHLKTSSNADLSVGGGAGYTHASMGGASADGLSLQAGGLIRVFLAPAVAFSTAFGLVVNSADLDGYDIGAVDVLGSAGLHYFF